MNLEFLDFDIPSPSRFSTLQKFYLALKVEKELLATLDSDEWEVRDDPDWRDYLDPDAKSWFANVFDYESEEGEVYRALFLLTDPTIRWEHPMFNVPGNWDLECLTDAILQTDCDFGELVECAPQKGKLSYRPHCYPFGGTEALVELLESFGMNVTYDSWQVGPHRRHINGWNYERAQQLVAAGQGVTWENVPVN